MLIKLNKQYHDIKVVNPHPGSLASYLLHKDKLRRKERLNKHPEWRTWLTFRNRFLKNVIRKNKILECYFCGIKPLEKNTNNPRKKHPEATIDHIHPLSKGGKRYDETNLCVACRRCNERKADISINDFIKREKDGKKEYYKRTN